MRMSPVLSSHSTTDRIKCVLCSKNCARWWEGKVTVSYPLSSWQSDDAKRPLTIMLFHYPPLSPIPLPALMLMPSDVHPSYPSLLLSSLLVTAHSSSFLEGLSSWFTVALSSTPVNFLVVSILIKLIGLTTISYLSSSLPLSTPVLTALPPP